MKEREDVSKTIQTREKRKSEIIADEFTRFITELKEDRLEKVKVLIEMELMERDRHRGIIPKLSPND